MLCVIARLNEEANERFASLRAAVLPRETAPQPLYGHITLATYLPDDHKAFVKDCAELVAGAPSFTVRYERIGIFPVSGVIFAEPGKNPYLSLLHGRIVEKYGPSLDRWTGGDGWFPHTTLIVGTGEGPDALLEGMRKRFVPFEARIGRVEFSLVRETDFEIVEAVDLG